MYNLVHVFTFKDNEKPQHTLSTTTIMSYNVTHDIPTITLPVDLSTKTGMLYRVVVTVEYDDHILQELFSKNCEWSRMFVVFTNISIAVVDLKRVKYHTSSYLYKV